MAPSAARSSDPLELVDEFGGSDPAGGSHPEWPTRRRHLGKPAGGAEWAEATGGDEGADATGGDHKGGIAGGDHGAEAAEGVHGAEDSGEAEAARRSTRVTPSATTDSSITRSRTVNRRSG